MLVLSRDMTAPIVVIEHATKGPCVLLIRVGLIPERVIQMLSRALAKV